MGFTLYNYFRSSASFRARIAMNLKGLEFDYKPVHLLNNGGEQHSAGYTDLNPSHEVPTLVHNGKVIGQSMAIMAYLDRIKPEPLLFPNEAYRNALVMQACEIVNAGTQPLINLRILGYMEKNFGITPEQKKEWIHQAFRNGLTALEAIVSKHGGEYAIGDHVTAADVCLVPQLVSTERFDFDLSPYKACNRVRANAEKLEAFKKAAPQNQPDTPKS